MTALMQLYKANTHAELVEYLVKEYGIALGSASSNSTQATPTTGVDAITAVLRPNHMTNPHRARREEMAQRVRLYRDDYAADIGAIIDTIWTRADYQEKLKSYLSLIQPSPAVGGVAQAQNVTARIVNEVASLYDKPALRLLGNDAAQKRFKLDEKRLRLHEITQEYHRLLWLCNEVLVWQFVGVDGKTKLRIVTPDTFDAVPHPGDVTVMAGVIMQSQAVSLMPATIAGAKMPRFEIWDDTYRYLLNSSGQMVDETGQPATDPVEHKFGRIPGALLHRREPSDRCLDPRAGRDIACAHRAVTLLAIKLLALSKEQGEQQPVLQGNLANVAKNQTADGENPWVLPPEVTASLLNTVTDPGHLLKVKREVLVSVGQTYGISYEQLTFEETSGEAGSAKMYQVRREKLAELRTEQRRRALVNEAEVISLIGYGSQADELKVDHREQALPQDPSEGMALLDLRTRLGMDSPIKALMREDPDLSLEDALALMRENASQWSIVIQVLRALNIPAAATAANPGNDPQINGANKVVEKVDPAALVSGGTGVPSSSSSAPAPAPPPPRP